MKDRFVLLESSNEHLKLRSQKGFTLIELLISVCIFAIIAGALGGVLFSGIKLWRRAQDVGYSQTNVLLELELFSRRIRQSLEIEHIPFQGDGTYLEFSTLSANSILKVRYRFNSMNRSLIYGKIEYEDTIEESLDEEEFVEKSLFKVKEASFSYLIFDDESSTYLWSDSLEAEETEAKMPAAVKINITDEKDKQFEKIVFIPIYEKYL